MMERAQYEKELKDMSSGEEEDLKMFDDGDQNEKEKESDDEMEAAEVEPSRWKGKQKANDANDAFDDDPQAGAKQRRPRMDPFAGECFCKFSSFWVAYGALSGYGDTRKSKQIRTIQ
jgi:exosome complex protein LRP1